MKKIYTFEQVVMNGTVTASSVTVCFASRELAERTRQAVVSANEGHDIGMGLRTYCTDIKETTVYECDGEVPILQEA